MKVLHTVVLLALLLSAIALDEAGKPRRNKNRKRSGFSLRPVTWGGAKVVTVPKCDRRAYSTEAKFAAKCRGIVPPISAKAAPLPNLPKVVSPAFPRPVLHRPMLKATAAKTGGQSAACTGRKGVCKSRKSCTGSVVPGICPGPSDWTCCVPKGSGGGGGSSGGGACLKNFNGQAFANMAIKYQQHYAQRGVRYSQPSRQFGYDVSYADCTSFGYSVMQAAGYGCLFNNARWTGAMKPLMAARGGWHQVARTGDVAFWGDHFGIVVNACAGGKVDMVAMGLSGCRRTGCITVASLKSWGSGGWIGFWTPRP